LQSLQEVESVAKVRGKTVEQLQQEMTQ